MATFVREREYAHPNEENVNVEKEQATEEMLNALQSIRVADETNYQRLEPSMTDLQARLNALKTATPGSKRLASGSGGSPPKRGASNSRRPIETDGDSGSDDDDDDDDQDDDVGKYVNKYADAAADYKRNSIKKAEYKVLVRKMKKLNDKKSTLCSFRNKNNGVKCSTGKAEGSQYCKEHRKYVKSQEKKAAKKSQSSSSVITPLVDLTAPIVPTAPAPTSSYQTDLASLTPINISSSAGLFNSVSSATASVAPVQVAPIPAPAPTPVAPAPSPAAPAFAFGPMNLSNEMMQQLVFQYLYQSMLQNNGAPIAIPTVAAPMPTPIVAPCAPPAATRPVDPVQTPIVAPAPSAPAPSIPAPVNRRYASVEGYDSDIDRRIKSAQHWQRKMAEAEMKLADIALTNEPVSILNSDVEVSDFFLGEPLQPTKQIDEEISSSDEEAIFSTPSASPAPQRKYDTFSTASAGPAPQREYDTFSTPSPSTQQIIDQADIEMDEAMNAEQPLQNNRRNRRQQNNNNA